MHTVRTKLGDNGRVIVPTSFRQQLHWSSGEDIILSINNDELLITTPVQALAKLQMKVKRQVEKLGHDISSSQELIETRRQEANNE